MSDDFGFACCWGGGATEDRPFGSQGKQECLSHLRRQMPMVGGRCGLRGRLLEPPLLWERTCGVFVRGGFGVKAGAEDLRFEI